MDRPRYAVRDEVSEGRLQQDSEFGLAHLTRGHHELSVFDRPQAADVTVDRYVIGWVNKDHLGPPVTEETVEGAHLGGVGAKQMMLAEKPEVA